MPAGISIRQRMLAAYRRQAQDSIPVGVYVRHLPRGSLEREVRNAGVGIIDSYPATSLLSPPWHLNPGCLSEVKNAHFTVAHLWEDGQAVETRTYRTPVGTVWQRSRRDPGYDSDWITKFYIQKPEDYRVVQYLVENTVLRSNREAIQARREELGEDGVLLGRLDRSPFQKLLIELAGPERLHVDLHECPEAVLELLGAIERRLDEAFGLALETSAEVLWQPDNISSDLTPPECFGKYCVPCYEKRAPACRQAGKLYLVHMDGRLRALRNLIARCLMDGVESFSLPETGGDLPLAEARALWPDKAVLPNFPATLCLEDDRRIEAWLRETLSPAQDAAPHMLQLSEDLPPGAWRRVLLLICSWKKAEAGTAP